MRLPRVVDDRGDFLDTPLFPRGYAARTVQRECRVRGVRVEKKVPGR